MNNGSYTAPIVITQLRDETVNWDVFHEKYVLYGVTGTENQPIGYRWLNADTITEMEVPIFSVLYDPREQKTMYILFRKDDVSDARMLGNLLRKYYAEQSDTGVFIKHMRSVMDFSALQPEPASFDMLERTALCVLRQLFLNACLFQEDFPMHNTTGRALVFVTQKVKKKDKRRVTIEFRVTLAGTITMKVITFWPVHLDTYKKGKYRREQFWIAGNLMKRIEPCEPKRGKFPPNIYVGKRSKIFSDYEEFPKSHVSMFNSKIEEDYTQTKIFQLYRLLERASIYADGILSFEFSRHPCQEFSYYRDDQRMDNPWRAKDGFTYTEGFRKIVDWCQTLELEVTYHSKNVRLQNQEAIQQLFRLYFKRIIIKRWDDHEPPCEEWDGIHKVGLFILSGNHDDFLDLTEEIDSSLGEVEVTADEYISPRLGEGVSYRMTIKNFRLLLNNFQKQLKKVKPDAGIRSMVGNMLIRLRMAADIKQKKSFFMETMQIERSYPLLFCAPEPRKRIKDDESDIVYFLSVAPDDTLSDLTISRRGMLQADSIQERLSDLVCDGQPDTIACYTRFEGEPLAFTFCLTDMYPLEYKKILEEMDQVKDNIQKGLPIRTWCQYAERWTATLPIRDYEKGVDMEEFLRRVAKLGEDKFYTFKQIKGFKQDEVLGEGFDSLSFRAFGNFVEKDVSIRFKFQGEEFVRDHFRELVGFHGVYQEKEKAILYWQGSLEAPEQNVFENGCPIRKIQFYTELPMEACIHFFQTVLIPLFTVEFVKLSRFTVLPFPFVFLREAAQMAKRLNGTLIKEWKKEYAREHGIMPVQIVFDEDSKAFL